MIWTLLYNFIFIILVSNIDVNGRTSRKPQKKLKFPILDGNIIRSNQFQYESEEKKYENNKINGDEKKKSHAYNNISSFRAPENHGYGRKSPYYLHIKRDGEYRHDTNSNNELSINEKLNTISNAFIQNGRVTKGKNKNTPNNAPKVNNPRASLNLPSPQSSTLSNTTENLDYMDVTFDSIFPVISQLSPYFAYIYFFDEVKRISVSHQEIKARYDQIYNNNVQKLLNEIPKAINSCKNEKDVLKRLINTLEDPNMLKKENIVYDKKYNEYENKKDEFLQCLLNKNNDNIFDMYDMETNILNMLENLKCQMSCDTKTFFNMIKTYLVEFEKISYTEYDNYINQYKSSYNSFSNYMRKIVKIIDDKYIINSISFTLMEMKYIMERFDYHLEKAKNSMDIVASFSNVNEREMKIKKNLIENYFTVSSNYSIFKLSADSLVILQKALIHKEKIIKNLFGSIISDLEKKMTNILDSLYFMRECSTMISASEETLKFAEDACNRDPRIIESFKLYTNLEITKIKKDYDKKIIEIREVKKSIELHTTSIKSACNDNMIIKDFIEDKKKSTHSDSSPQEKVKNLLSIIEYMDDKKQTITDNVNRMNDYSNKNKELRTKIHTLVDAVKDQEKNIEDLIRKEQEIRLIKENIKIKLEYIKGIIEKLNDIIYINKNINNEFEEIDKIIKETLFNKDDFDNKKTELHTKIKETMNTFYSGDLQVFVEKLSSFLKNHEVLYEKEDSKGKLEELLKSTIEEEETLKRMKCESVSEIINTLKGEEKKILTLKNDIINKQFENIHSEMTKLSNQLQIEYEDFERSVSDYEAEKQKLAEHKDKIIKRKNMFAENEHENDEDVPEGQNTYNEFVQDKENILKKETVITSKINKLREKIQNVKSELQKHGDVMQNFEINYRKSASNTKALLEKIKNANHELKLNEDEKNFIVTKGILMKTMEEIENTKRNIGTLKNLNVTSKRSKVNKQNIESLIKNKDILKEKIEIHIQNVENDKLIEPTSKTQFIMNLNREKNNIDQQLKDIYINELKEAVDKTLSYCQTVRENVMNNNGTSAEVLDKNEIDWVGMNVKIQELHGTYLALDRNVNDLINKQYGEIITLISKHIIDEGNDVEIRAEKFIHDLEKLKTRLSSFENNEYIKKYENSIKEELGKLKAMSDKILKEIDENYDKLIIIKIKSTDYVAESNKVKNKQIDSSEKNDKTNMFNKNRDDMEKINENISHASKELDSIKKVENMSKEIDILEIQYDRVLIKHMVQMINDKNTETSGIMDKIKSYIENIEKIKSKIFDERRKNTSDLMYSQYDEESKTNSKKVEEILENAIKRKEESENGQNMENVKNIKSEVINYLQQATDYYNAVEKALGDIKNVHNLLLSTNGKSIAEEISKNTSEAYTLREKTKNEFEKMHNVIDDVKKQLDQAKDLQKNIHTDLDGEQIDDKVKQIKQIHYNIENKKDGIDEYLTNIRAHKENCLLEIRNAERGKIKIDFLQENKGNHELRDIAIEKINENIDTCKTYEKEVLKIEEDSIKEHDLFLTLINNISDALKESLILGVETKSKKRKIDATTIMKDIEKEYTEIKEELQQSVEYLNQLEKKYTIITGEDELNNQTSMDAKVSLQYNIEKAKHNLLKIKNIENEVESISSRAKNSFDLMSKFSALNESNVLENVEKEAEECIKYLGKIKEEKKLMMEKRDNFNVIKSENKNIEEDLKKHCKLFEIGLLNKINEMVNNKKSYMDSAKERLISSIRNFTSLFNGFNLKDYKIGKNLEDYKRKINELNNEFLKLYELIQHNVKNGSENSTDPDGAKVLREESKNELKKLENIEEETKKYLRDVNKIESFRLIHYMKENVDELNEKCKKEYSEVDEGNNAIEKIIGDIKKLKDKNSSSTKLVEAIERNDDIKKKKNHFSYKIDAKDIFDQIVKSAKFINITIVNELSAQAYLQNTTPMQLEPNSEIIFESEQFAEDTDKLNVHKNIQDAYNSVLQIHKHSDDIIKKQEECEMLVNEGKYICFKIKSINELKDTIEKTNIKKSTIANEINNAFSKLSELNRIKCSYENCTDILKENYAENLKQQRDTFNEAKSSNADKSKLNDYMKRVENEFESLNILEKTIEILNANETSQEVIEDKKSSILQIITKLEDIENKIKDVNSSYDELLGKGRQCEIYKYTSIINSLNNQINDYSIIINSKKENVGEYLKFIESNYRSIYKDVESLSENLDGKSINVYDKAKIEEANKLSLELTTAVYEYEEIIHTMKNEFIVINEKTKIDDLENSAKKLKIYYTNLNNKEDIIKEFHNKINLIKLQEIKATSEKYFDIAKIFTDVLEDQKKALMNTQNKQNDLKHKVTEIEKELINLDISFTLVSINAFDEIYKKIKSKVEELSKLEETNLNELKKVKRYKEYGLYLLNRKENLLGDIDKYVERDKLKNENNEMKNEIRNYITGTNKIQSILSETVQILLENIKKNEKLCASNNIKDFISRIVKIADDTRENFKKSFPEKEKFYQIESYYKEIKAIVNEIDTNSEINLFIEDTNKNIQDRIASTQNSEDVEKIKEVIIHITNNHTKAKATLSQVSNALNRIKTKKKEMDTLFVSLSKEHINNYNSAKNFMNDSNNIIKIFEDHLGKISSLIKYSENEINELEKKMHNILNAPVIDNASDGQKKLLGDIEEQREKLYEEEVPKLSREQNNSDESDLNDGNNTTENKNGYHSKPGGDTTRILYAQVILGLSVCYGIAFIAFNRNDEEKIGDHSLDEEFNGGVAFNGDDKEEVIDVCFDENYDSE